MYAALFALLATLYVITLNSLVFELLVLGMKVRVACASLIYRHSLSLSSYTFVKTTVGQIINLLSNDLKRFDGLFPFLPFLLWITPVELVLGIYIVDVTCGHVAIICIGLLILAAFAICRSVHINFWSIHHFYISGYASQKVSTYRKKIAVKTDYRVRLMNGIIAGIQVIKMYTWEKYFVKVVETAREYVVNFDRFNFYINCYLGSNALFCPKGFRIF
jgi:ATP-binding cassette subfamily C (CFTR/MRP) protein 4